MTRTRSLLFACALTHTIAFSVRAHAGDLTVVAVEPARHALSAPVGAPIVIHFDRPIRPESLESGRELWAFGRWSGTVQGTYELSNGNSTVTLVPVNAFSAGESVMVIISHNVEAADGSRLRDGGYSYQFWTAAGRNPRGYRQVDVLTTRTSPGQRTQAYGGIAADLNGDRFPDITIVNEITADLRVFLNRADGTGLYHDFIQPTFPVNNRASPSEPTDFNRDGHTDICVANINANSVSILLGNGDGTFASQQEITVGFAPRGIAVLDVDGDGDVDIVSAVSGSNKLALLLNDGEGVFGSPTLFEAGGNGEWALAAADMNDDGLLDLVVGARTSQTILVNVANGDGTFSLASTIDSGGRVWMLVCGDVNGDGTEDVAVVNSFDDNGAILLGDGRGGLALPQIYPTDPFALATDLGDLDGDGDLDWVTSSYGGDWFLFANDGSGSFALTETFPAPEAASCALMLDIDNDGDLDLALIDELADVVILMKHDGAPAPPPPPPPPPPIPVLPTASHWSAVMLVLLLLVAGARHAHPSDSA